MRNIKTLQSLTWNAQCVIHHYLYFLDTATVSIAQINVANRPIAYENRLNPPLLNKYLLSPRLLPIVFNAIIPLVISSNAPHAVIVLIAAVNMPITSDILFHRLLPLFPHLLLPLSFFQPFLLALAYPPNCSCILLPEKQTPPSFNDFNMPYFTICRPNSALPNFHNRLYSSFSTSK